ncbi:hypothetical protein CKAN_02012600 [Cinnamomum micranthum f. kanehirae]|uniref:Uncharacterized protein n=1 Tax=Cinnamomum micranthum f. kanehirae TaxID=337451 RepID=A0A443PJR7_9MAGN|nr:hypothetical protein CKAN_02012600 [Cinnamomum micranthum f. kanehirae]
MSDGTPISSAAAILDLMTMHGLVAVGQLDLKNTLWGVGGVLKGDIAPCKNVPGDVKWQMDKLILEGKKDRAKKRQLNEEIGNPYGTPGGDADEDDVEVEVVEPFTNPITPTTTSRKGKEKVSQISTQNKRRGVSNTSQPPMSNFFAPRTSPRS